MLIYVRTVTCKSIGIDVELSDTILAIKEMIYGKEGLPVHQQRLWYEAKCLDNERSLADYNIKKEAVLLVLLDDSDAS